MQVRQTEIARLLKALGLDAIVTTDRADLARRVNKKPGIHRLMDEGQTIADPDLNLLYERIVQDQAGGNLVEVIADEEEPETFPLVDREGLTDADAAAESGGDPNVPPEPSGAKPKKKGKKMSATATKSPAKKSVGKTTKTSTKKSQAESSPKKADTGTAKGMSQIEAAFKVLRTRGKPMSTQEMVAAMVEKGLWSSPAGKTPHNTLYSAILREIDVKGKQSRFKKDSPGKFVSVS